MYQLKPLPKAIIASVLIPAAAMPSLAHARTGQLEEVIVTAQKREENINDVGLTISALRSDVLQERNIASLADIAAAVPGLSYINSANNTPVYNLRGIGFYDTSLGSYPTTSVYLDQVALPFPVLTNLTAFDLERIEVMKGPQGTLFGQNSTGGAINYIANKPSSELEAGFDVSYGRFEHYIGNGYIGGPLTDSVRARVAVRAESSDNWQKSYTRNDENGEKDNFAGRLLVDWNATETLTLQFNLNGWQDQDDPQATQYSQFNQQAITNVAPEVRNYPLAPDDPRAADWSENNAMERDLRFWQSSVRADWEFMPNIALTSITSYINFDQEGALDQDGINFDDIDLRAFWGDIDSVSQELRIANLGEADVRWIVGANYSKDEVFYRENLVYGDGSGGNNFAGTPFAIESSENFSDQEMENYAVFGNVDWSLTSTLTLKAGVRYTKAKREADICNIDGSLTERGGPANRNFVPGGVNRLFDFLADIFAPGNTYPDIPVGGCFNLNDPDPQNPEADPTRPFEPGLFTSEIDEDNLSWRAGLDYRLTDDVLLYTNVAKGYKAGGFGNINAAINFQFRPVKQESILSYEAGFKAQLASGLVSLNGAVFHMEYEDKQLRTKDINILFGIIDALNNVPESHINGAELELQAVPVEGLTVGFATTYLDHQIDKYSGINAGGVVADFGGTEIPFTPEWQAGANARYEFAVTDGLTGFVGAQVNYRSETWAVIGAGSSLADGYEIEEFTTVDAQAGVESEAGWRVTLWGKNLTDEHYWTNVVAGQDQIVRYAQWPITYGISFGMDF